MTKTLLNEVLYRYHPDFRTEKALKSVRKAAAIREFNKPDTCSLENLFDRITEREKNILFARFGLNGDKPRTLQSIGDEYGIGRERVRQIQNIAVYKIRRALNKMAKENGN